MNEESEDITIICEGSEEYRAECGDCGEVMDLVNLQNHDCVSPATEENDGKECNEKEENLVLKLAEAVQARPPLWDHTLPLKQRGKDVREKLWKEVWLEINKMIALSLLEKKWKNLKNTFLKHLKTYTPSGSGSENKKKWRHFDQLHFLAEKNLPKATFCNVCDTGSSTSSSTETGNITPTAKQPKKTAKRSDDQELVTTSSSDISSYNVTPSSAKRKKKSDEMDEMLFNILKEPPPSQSTGQTVPSPALLTVQSVLDKLPTRVGMQAEIEILNKVYALYADHKPTKLVYIEEFML